MVFTHIIHLADLHIRAGDNQRARINEYSCVFNNFIESISKLDCITTSCTVIAGDIFHHKGRIDNAGLTLLFNFIDKLLHLTPIFIICGNHDYRQENTNDADSLEIIETIFKKAHHANKLHYLKNTGLYEFENIGFGVTSIKDVLKTTSGCGIVDELPEYPKPIFSQNINAKVALFHGTISENTYPIKWFNGYDYGVFGDIHKQQIHKTEEFLWGYPGSLVQQDDGESVNNHGFILWNLDAKTAEAHSVYNKYASVTIQQNKDDMWMVRMGYKNVLFLENAVKDPMFPKEPNIRFIGNFNKQTELNQLLKTNNINPCNIRITKQLGTTIMSDFDIEYADKMKELKENLQTIGNLNHKDNWIKYIRSIYPTVNAEEIIYKPSSICIDTTTKIPKDIIDKIKLRNQKIIDFIQAYEKEYTISNLKPHIKLQYIEWDYILCYGSNNYINFINQDSNIILINGNNATGKSAILDVLSLGIFGELTTVRNQCNMGKKMSSKIINDARPKHERAGIVIVFYYGDDIYEIDRSFTIKSNNVDNIDGSQVTVSKILENDEKEIIVEGSSANTWILKHFGDILNLELSNMMCQIDVNNFFTQSNSVQREIIEKSLNLGSISLFSDILSEADRAYNYIIKDIATYIAGMSSHKQIVVTPDDIARHTSLKDEIEVLNAQIKVIDIERLNKMKGVETVSDSDKQIKEKVINKSIEEYKVKIKDLNVDEITSIMNRLVHERDHLMKKEIELQNELYNNITIDKSIEYYLDELEQHIENEPRRDMSREAIERLQNKLNNWEKEQPREWIDNPDILSEEIFKYETQLEKYKQQFETIKEMNIQKPKGVIIKDCKVVTSKTIMKMIEELNILKEIKIEQIVPCKEQQHKAKWIKRYTQWLDKINDVSECTAEQLISRMQHLNTYLKKVQIKKSRYDELTNIIAKHKTEISEIEKLPYNPECHACQQQTHRKRYILLKQELTEYEKEYKKIEKFMVTIDETDINDLTNELKELPDVLKKREFYEYNVSTIEAEREEWEKAEKEWELMDKNNKEISKTIRNIQEYEWGIYECYNKLYNQTMSSITKYNNLISKITIFLKEYDKYKEDIDIIYDSELSLVKWNEWNSKKKEIEYKIVATKLKLIFEKIAEYEVQNKIIQEWNYWNNLAKYIEYNKVENEFIKLNERLNEIKDEFIRLDKTLNDSNLFNSEAQYIIDLHSELKIKYEIIKQIQICMIGDKKEIEGFRNWLFKTEALPLIERELNSFLSRIDTIQMSITYNNTGFIYIIEDRGNKPSINTISGYQKFIVNLAMRIALSTLGTNGTNLQTLFIDEGFTAFDGVNANKIQDIFDILLEKYNNIVIMSHMDVVKEIANTRIDIVREKDTRISKVQYGSIVKYKKRKKVKAVNDSNDALMEKLAEVNAEASGSEPVKIKKVRNKKT
jgi:DNA repair exonuclease SbcCD ATPase subunit